MIPINLPKIGEEEIQAVVEVMRSGILTTGLGAGPKVKEFEKNYEAFAGVKHAIGVNTGTAALHAALLAAGIGYGDEVIVPSFTFVATAEAVVLAGAKPVFADIDPQTYTLSPDAVQDAFTKKTKGIIPVDLYGIPADTRFIKETAKNGEIVIEDCAQSHGATYMGRPAGAMADLAAWSLYAAKNIGTGEGGVVTTDNDELAEKVKMVRTHGEKVKYQSLMLGTNYRMTEIQAAIGLIQLKRLPDFYAKRKQNAEYLTKLLQESDNSEKLCLPPKLKDRTHSGYLYTVRIKDATENQRNRLINELHNNLGNSIYQKRKKLPNKYSPYLYTLA